MAIKLARMVIRQKITKIENGKVVWGTTKNRSGKKQGESWQVSSAHVLERFGVFTIRLIYIVQVFILVVTIHSAFF